VDDWALGVSVASAVAAIVAVVYARQLWLETRLASQRDLRAYVGIQPTAIGILTPEVAPWLRVRIINFGKTPAHHVRTVGAVAVLPNPLPPEFQFAYSPANRDEGSFVLQPTQSIESEKAATAALSAADIDLLRSDRFALYGYGEVQYEDIFDEPRSTRYCLLLVKGPDLIAARERAVTVGNAVVPQPGRWVYANQYNEVR
jgi:hypothetical protein